MTACPQPRCTGTIVDDYCDVCSSPAGAPPFVPAGAAASAPSPGHAAGHGLTAGPRRVWAAVRRGVGGCGLVPTRLRRRLLPNSARLSHLRFRPEYDRQSGPDLGRHQEYADFDHDTRCQRDIQLEDLADSARPSEAVRIQGTYRGGAGTFLRVQRWERGKWQDFPLATKTDQSGQFITQAEFGKPGRYWLRVLDPDSEVASKPFVLVING